MEEGTGKWFPRSNSARDVRDRLVELAGKSGAELLYNKRVSDVWRGTSFTRSLWASRLLAHAAPDAQTGLWMCESACGTQFCASQVILATGGKSFPAVGTDGKGYQIAQRLGHSLQHLYPALTPLTGVGRPCISMELDVDELLHQAHIREGTNLPVYHSMWEQPRRVALLAPPRTQVERVWLPPFSHFRGQDTNV